VLGNPLGSANGAGFGWKDVTVVKLGVSYDYTPDVTLRAGFNHSDQAIPSNQTFFNILAPATVQDHLTFGATWKTSTGGELSVAYAHGFKKTVNGANSIPPGNPPGFGGGNANISLEENSLGVAYGWKF
jgi:long-chain fatty acid transport protein